ncbi:pancreatic lipase-related protein 2-like [Pectinophora gossypiella]|uniref:pancreatic lipase-related protein 2-like n=1 Tax=Pectinophora gossypiella TaxID=13191 RepID=UPI00214F1A98|nr:pancreatic lipase-related protein 2-like [Pectinophora gossypiella]
MCVLLKTFWWFLCLNVILCSSRVPYRSDEGYPTGLMSVCPGSTKPATIPRSQLRHLFFVVQGKGSRQKYTYWHAKDIAKDPRIDFKRKTVVILLGYLDSSGFPIASMFANEYEARGYNVIIVDNQRFATVHYYLASRLMRPVGRHVAAVLVQLRQSGLEPGGVELLGFSLGGQTVSYVGAHYQALTGRNVSKITALEPSGPCFRTLGPKDRLDASNADYVEVIHTNIDGFGMATRMGHVDIYVNGGEYQPSDITMFPCTVTCSHFRVLTLWVQALKNPRKFVAIKCDSIQQAREADCFKNVPLETNLMGLAVDKSKHGIFYLSTDKSFPFYLGEKGLDPDFVYWKRITDVNDGNETEIYT